ncbi:MAG: regulatory protein, FmdB family [uncultured bacterium]|nr:MAG: regulatory protein, FmdB family [uncultured bacterium]
MPLYEYKCESCEETFEIMQKISEAPLKKCPKCSGKLTKLISSPAFHLKGTGWYKTDYAAPNSQASTKTSGPKGTSEAKTEKKEAASTETNKPVTKEPGKAE